MTNQEKQNQTIIHNLAIDLVNELSNNEFLNKFLTIQSNQGNIRVTNAEYISNTNIKKIISLINKSKICKGNNLKVGAVERFDESVSYYSMICHSYDFILIPKTKW